MLQTIVSNEVDTNPLSSRIQLFDAANIEAFSGPPSSQCELAKKFFVSFIKNKPIHFIDNVDTKLMLLTINDICLPVTVNDEQYDNSFVCSPYTHYVSYAFFVLEKIQNSYLKSFLGGLLKFYGKLLRGGKINKVVTVNNWLFTTNPHAPLDKSTLETIVNHLKNKFPDHAIIFRSVTREVNPEFYDALVSQNFDMIASRLVYLSDARNEKIFHTRIFKSDMKHLRESPYKIIPSEEITDDDLPKIIELYRALYIEKYSKLNPQFNVNYIKHALKQGVLHLQLLKRDDQIEGVCGYFCQNNVMISPFFGYDPIKSEKNGVYRILCTLLLLNAQKLQVLFNQSAGGSFFKKIRRAEGFFEYTAVYNRHLPFSRKLPWNLLKVMMNSIGATYMKRY